MHSLLLVVALQTGKKLCDTASPLSLCVTLYCLTTVMAMEGAGKAPGYPFETSTCSVFDDSNPTRNLALCLLLSGSLKRGDDCSWDSKETCSFKGGNGKKLKDVRTQEYLQWSRDPQDLLYHLWC